MTYFFIGDHYNSFEVMEIFFRIRKHGMLEGWASC